MNVGYHRLACYAWQCCCSLVNQSLVGQCSLTSWLCDVMVNQSQSGSGYRTSRMSSETQFFMSVYLTVVSVVIAVTDDVDVVLLSRVA